MPLTTHLGYKPEEVQLQPPRDVLRGLHRVIQIVDRERRGDAEAKAEEQRHHPRSADVWREWPARHFRTVEKPHVIGAAVRDDAQLFLALQQRLVHLAIAFSLALQHRVIDTLAVQIEGRGLLDLELSHQRPFLGSSGLVFVPDRGDGFVDLRLDLPPSVRDLTGDVLYLGMTVAVALQQPDAVALELRRSRLEILNEGILDDGGEPVLIFGFRDLLVRGFALNALRLRARDRLVQLVQPRPHDVLAVLERERVLVLTVFSHEPLARLHERLLTCDLTTEPVERLLCVFELELEVLVNVLLREDVNRARCERRIGGSERNVYEPAAADRRHLHAPLECRDEAVLIESTRCGWLRW